MARLSKTDRQKGAVQTRHRPEHPAEFVEDERPQIIEDPESPGTVQVKLENGDIKTFVLES